ncbi:MAG: protease modulator HflC [Candidatus Dadabacteria bacterium]|nr:MAG: protease modulator HflC [Candidatus Dadabacteria bacterium]
MLEQILRRGRDSMSKAYSGLIALIIFAVIVLSSALYRIPEGKQAIITQFGKPIGGPRTEAGLYIKIPFIQRVRLLEKRILNWDGDPTKEIPTRDKKFIVVDTTARWRISDPLLFYNSLTDERVAFTRMGNILEDAVRTTISSRNLVETVRNTNRILEESLKIDEAAAEENEGDQSIEAIEREARSNRDIEPISPGGGREKLSQKIVEKASTALKNYGIELIDVQLRRVSYSGKVEEKVYERMISERKRIAEKILAYGNARKAQILGETSRELQRIQSEAYQAVQEIKGKAEGQAVKIYADAVGSDQDFYRFVRTLEAYKKGLRSDSRLILSADSEFFRLLREGKE